MSITNEVFLSRGLANVSWSFGYYELKYALSVLNYYYDFETAVKTYLIEQLKLC